MEFFISKISLRYSIYPDIRSLHFRLQRSKVKSYQKLETSRQGRLNFYLVENGKLNVRE